LIPSLVGPEPAEQVEQQLPAGLGKGQVAEFVQHHEVQAAKLLGQPPLLAGASFGLELVDQFDHVEEPAAPSVADQGAGDRDRQVRLAGARAAHQHHVALVGEEVPARQVAHPVESSAFNR
jgi:hypothetical protein